MYIYRERERDRQREKEREGERETDRERERNCPFLPTCSYGLVALVGEDTQGFTAARAKLVWSVTEMFHPTSCSLYWDL